MKMSLPIIALLVAVPVQAQESQPTPQAHLCATEESQSWQHPFCSLSWQGSLQEADPSAPVPEATSAMLTRTDRAPFDTFASPVLGRLPLAVDETGRGFFDLRPFTRGFRDSLLAVAEGGR